MLFSAGTEQSSTGFRTRGNFVKPHLKFSTFPQTYRIDLEAICPVDFPINHVQVLLKSLGVAKYTNHFSSNVVPLGLKSAKFGAWHLQGPRTTPIHHKLAHFQALRLYG